MSIRQSSFFSWFLIGQSIGCSLVFNFNLFTMLNVIKIPLPCKTGVWYFKIWVSFSSRFMLGITVLNNFIQDKSWKIYRKSFYNPIIFQNGFSNHIKQVVLWFSLGPKECANKSHARTLNAWELEIHAPSLRYGRDGNKSEQPQYAPSTSP